MSDIPPTVSSPVLGYRDIQQILGDRVSLLASCPGVHQGGLFALSRGDWEVIDTVPTVGLALDGIHIARALYTTPGDPVEGTGEVAWYDEKGLARFERLDGVHDVHDVMFDPSHPGWLLVVSTGTNSVHRLRPGRSLEPVLGPAALGDGGHRNCLAVHSGLTYVTAFGEGTNHREWNRETDVDTGLLIEIETGRVVIEGLCRPHSPLRTAADDGWIIANSGRGEVLWVSDGGERTSLELGDWPQDVIRCGEFLLVGVSPAREARTAIRSGSDSESVRLVVVDESTRSVVGTCELPIPSVYDLLLVPDALMAGLRVGSATNVLRLMDRCIRDSMAGDLPPLAVDGPDQHQGEVVVRSAPTSVVIGDDFTVSLTVVYRGSQRGRTFGDDAIRLGLTWRESGEASRRVFQSVLSADRGIDFDVIVESPRSTGRHTLEIGLLQEHVAWFGTTAVLEIDVLDERPTVADRPPVGDVGAGLANAATRREQKLADVRGVERWWHSIDLGDGVVTPGHKDPELITREWEDLELPVLAGKSVLDIGAWDGYFSFTAERHGAERVVAVDDWVWALRKERFREVLEQVRESGRGRVGLRDNDELWDFEGLPGRAGFDVCHRHLASRVQPVVANYMDLDPEEIGTFDVVLYLGVLYHEPNPLASLERVRALTRGMAVIETSALFVPGSEDRSLAEFYPDDELGGDPTNWWSPNARATIGMAEAVGFSRTRISKAHPPEWDALPAGSPPLLYRLMLHCYVD